MVMVRMGTVGKHLAGRRVACIISSITFWLGYRQCCVKLLRGHVRNFWETHVPKVPETTVFSARERGRSCSPQSS